MTTIAQLVVDIEARTTGFQRGLATASSSLTRAGVTMSRAGASLTRSVSLPLAAAGTLAVKSAVDFETAFAGVRKTVDTTERGFRELEGGIRQMARSLPASANEIAGVAEAAGQLGIETNSILGFTRTMIDLGNATNLSANEAASSLARLANITQMPQSEFDRLGSTVVELGNNLATTEAEIVSMGLRIAGAGKQIGLTEDQIVSFAGALSSVGIRAEAGGSAISRTFVSMAEAVRSGGTELSDFARVAGTSASQFRRSFEDDAAGAVIAFIEGLGRISDSGGDVFGVLQRLGFSEVRVRDALLRAAGAGDLFRRSIDLGSKAWEDNTALTEEARKRYETTASQLKILKNQVTDVAIELGRQLIPVLKNDVIPAIRGALKWWKGLSDESRDLAVKLAGLAILAGPLLRLSGGILRVAGSFGKLLGVGSGAAGGAGVGGLALKLGRIAKLGGAAVVIEATADAIRSIGNLDKYTDSLDKWLRRWADVPQVFGGLGGAFSGLFDALDFSRGVDAMNEGMRRIRSNVQSGVLTIEEGTAAIRELSEATGVDLPRSASHLATAFAFTSDSIRTQLNPALDQAVGLSAKQREEMVRLGNRIDQLGGTITDHQAGYIRWFLATGNVRGALQYLRDVLKGTKRNTDDAADAAKDAEGKTKGYERAIRRIPRMWRTRFDVPGLSGALTQAQLLLQTLQAIGTNRANTPGQVRGGNRGSTDLQHGGYVTQTGLARVHRGEVWSGANRDFGPFGRTRQGDRINIDRRRFAGALATDHTFRGW